MTELRRFIGMTQFYRKFVPNFSRIAAPLNAMLKPNVDIKRDWTSEQDEAMATLKERLTTPPVLVHDDGTSPIELHADVSKAGLGAVLIIRKEGVAKPITYLSRSLNKLEL